MIYVAQKFEVKAIESQNPKHNGQQISLIKKFLPFSFNKKSVNSKSVTVLNLSINIFSLNLLGKKEAYSTNTLDLNHKIKTSDTLQDSIKISVINRSSPHSGGDKIMNHNNNKVPRTIPGTPYSTPMALFLYKLFLFFFSVTVITPFL